MADAVGVRHEHGFRDRHDAGRALAGALAGYEGRTDLLVLGLARGGVPVAAEVAAALGAPLDVLVVRKVGVPGYEETAMGAVGPGGVTLLDQGLIAALHVDRRTVAEAVVRAREEMRRRERAYRAGRPLPVMRGRTVILVDDGLATGATMMAAVQSVRAHEPDRVVVAVPVGDQDALGQLSAVADDVVCVATPDPMRAVGLWYEDFSATTDDEVRLLTASPPLAGASG
jgi:predicted phosphoribosyltransferase